MKLKNGSIEQILAEKAINFAAADTWTSTLLDWYDANKRELPWRENKDPYRIWVSEIMSQQTRIEAVIPYFENWMRLFPTPIDLIAASEDEVVRAWQGLGYYSRARNLQAGVREVVETYGGEMPRDRKLVEGLKGVGPYTAGAILSIAFNLPEAAVDGNVLRVYTRLYDIREDILKPLGKKLITHIVEQTLPQDRPGDFNQSLMDFGAMVCIPKSPRCENCPLQKSCASYKVGNQAELPVRIKKKEIPIIDVTVGIIECNGYYLLHRRPDAGLLRSMWEFPAVERMTTIKTASGSKQPILEGEQKLGYKEAHRALHSLVIEALQPLNQEEYSCHTTLVEKYNVKLQLEDEVRSTLVHVFSHRRWEMHAYMGTLYTTHFEELKRLLPPDWKFVKKEAFIAYPWAGPHGKFIELCK